MVPHDIVSPRRNAAGAIVRALRVAEGVFTAAAARHLAENVTWEGVNGKLVGKPAVADRLSGQWAWTPVMAAGVWDILDAPNGDVLARASFRGLGASPTAYHLLLSFDEANLVISITEAMEMPPAPQPELAITPLVAQRIDHALANGVPINVAYVRDDGCPDISLRGSLQTFDDTHLSLWLRNAEGGLAGAIRQNRPLSMLYRHSPTRTTLIIEGRGRIIDEVTLRQTIFERGPEIEQRHDPARKGIAALIKLTSIRGTTTEGPITISPPHTNRPSP